MEYFGDLRRNPFDDPNTDFSGHDFRLSKLALSCAHNLRPCKGTLTNS